MERVLSDNGNEFRGPAFRQLLERLGARHSRIHAGRPQTNGHVEALHKTILDECWRRAFVSRVKESARFGALNGVALSASSAVASGFAR